MGADILDQGIKWLPTADLER
jgi:hypothetical protein